MATITTIYTGGLRTEAVHVRSGSVLVTDAPVDNQGRGEAFSPTDLIAASLGSCMLTVMGIVADRHKIPLEGTKVSITKIMASDPRRVSEVHVAFEFPDYAYTDKEKELLERTAITCPVAKSLHPDLIQQVSFNYRQASQPA